MAEFEEERNRLNQLCRELLVLMGDIERMEEYIATLKKEAAELYKSIDAKLNGE